MDGLRIEARLETAARQAKGLAARWRSTLTTSDHRAMTESFYRAESLAHIALECAADQLEASYATELVEQMADEERHVAVFADWLGSETVDVPRPKVRRRPPAVWFGLLLVNEVCGYCQFHMLAGLLDDPHRRAAVDGIAADEVVHILRLLRWIEPLRPRPAFAEVAKVTGRFIRNLELRMSQFLPREELARLRTEMAGLVSELLMELVAPRA